MKLFDTIKSQQVWAPPAVKTTGWLFILILGLYIALNELIFPINKPDKARAIPKDITTEAPAATAKSISKHRDGVPQNNLSEKKSAPVEPIPMPPPQVSNNAMPRVELTKNWTEYGDKIVGWLVALAGAYNLIRRPKKKEE